MKRSRIITIWIAAAVCLCVIGAGALLSGRAEEQTADATVQTVAAWEHPEDPIPAAGSGEPIRNEYIVQRTDGTYDLVKTDDPQSLADDPDIAGVEQNRTVIAFGEENGSASAGQEASVAAKEAASGGTAAGAISGADSAEAAPGRSAMTITGKDVTDMQYGDRLVRAPEAWELLGSSKTATVRVAVVDTGVEADHPDLKGRVIKGTTIVEKTAAGNRYADDGRDDNGHGTHVAGIIAAEVENGQGINGIAGPADIEILPVKVLNDEGQGSTYDIIEGLHYAADHGASIINLSLGSYSRSEMEADAVKYAQNRGCLVIAAAGNESFNVQYTYPASYDGVISVGSVDEQGDRSYFSNFGDTLDIAAPGTDIVSSVPERIADQKLARGGTVYGTASEGYYVSMSGTSMAAPHAAGAAALYKAVNPAATGFDIGQLMIETAQDVGDPGKDMETGSGIVDAAAMLGGEITKNPLIIKSPSEGQEVYEEISLTAQIDPTMGIRTLRFYLADSDASQIDVTKDRKIAEIACDENNSFYDAVWDTKQHADGTYRLLAAVYDAEGGQIGETRAVTVRILNSIQDGFTLEATDPYGNGANAAAYTIYQNEGGGYVLAAKGRTSTLGYARIKQLSRTAEDYILIISGTVNEADGSNTHYILRRILSGEQRGSKIRIDGSESRQIAITATDSTDDPIEGPMLKICPDCGGNWMEGDSIRRIQSDTKLFLDDGAYRISLFRAKDRRDTVYYLEKTVRIAENGRDVSFSPADGVKVQGVYPEETIGEMCLEAADDANTIPFLGGALYGTTYYLPKDRTYRVKASLKAEDAAGSIWSVDIAKKDAVTTDADRQVEFAPRIGVSSFICDRPEIFTGEKLKTSCVFGDASGDELITMMGHFPALKIRTAGEDPAVIFEKESRWYAENPVWDPAKDYTGSVPPAAGEYIASLSFDAGPFGGLTAEEIPFTMKTRSGETEMTSTITVREDGIAYKAVGASLELFTWSADGKSWKKATDQSLKDSDQETGVISGIIADDIRLDDSGIHAAVITLRARKNGYQSPENYPGFAVVPFSSISDLAEIEIDAAQLHSVTVKALDRNGNPKAADLYLPVMSDGGSLTEPKYLKDLRYSRISASAAGTVMHIPAGAYEYMYGSFSANGRDNYLLAAEPFTTEPEMEIVLRGEDTSKLQVDAPEHETLLIRPVRQGSSAGPAVSLLEDRLYLSKGNYSLSAVMTDPAGEHRYTIERSETLDMDDDRAWTIGDSFTGRISLHQKRVAEDQTLTGLLRIEDGQGNLLCRAESIGEDGFFEEQVPRLFLGMEGGAEADLGEVAPGEFQVSADRYLGKGLHTLRMELSGLEGLVTGPAENFLVGADQTDPPAWKTSASLAYEWSDRMKLVLSWDPDKVKPAAGVSIAGYRIYYAENEMRKWKDLTGDTLIEGGSTALEIPPGSSFFFKVEAEDEFGNVSTDGPETEVMAQYPWLTIESAEGTVLKEFYTPEIDRLNIQQARFSAISNKSGSIYSEWYAARGVYLEDLIAEAGAENVTHVAVKANNMDPYTFDADSLTGDGFYYYPADYDGGRTVDAVPVKPMIVLSYTSSQTGDPVFSEDAAGSGVPRLMFGQRSPGDSNRPNYAKEVYSIVIYTQEPAETGGEGEGTKPSVTPAGPADSHAGQTPSRAGTASGKKPAGYDPATDVNASTPKAAAADRAKVDSRLLAQIGAVGISTRGDLAKKTMRISFRPVKNAVNYRVYYRTAGAKRWISAWTGGKTVYTMKKLKKNALYEFRIAAYAKKNGTWVRGRDSAVSCRYFAGAKKVKAKASGKKKIRVTWKKVKGASGYQVLYSSRRDMKNAKIRTVRGVNKKGLTLKKLRKGRTYYLCVRPVKKSKGKTYTGVLSGVRRVKVR